MRPSSLLRSRAFFCIGQPRFLSPLLVLDEVDHSPDMLVEPLVRGVERGCAFGQRVVHTSRGVCTLPATELKLSMAVLRFPSTCTLKASEPEQRPNGPPLMRLSCAVFGREMFGGGSKTCQLSPGPGL
eukprot:4761079-Pyramimonas_sp.AAC.1